MTQLNAVIPQQLYTTSSPTFAGLTVGSSTAMLKRVAGVLMDAVAGVDYLASYSETDTLATVMARGAITALQLTSTLAIGTSPFSVISTTVNTNLNADLLDGNHAAAFQAAGSTYLTGTLTSGRVPYASGVQTLVDSANLTFDGSLLNLTGTMGIGVAANATTGLNIVLTSTASSNFGSSLLLYSSGATTTTGLFGGAINTRRSGSPSVNIASILGLDFGAQYVPSSTLQGNCTVNLLQGVRAILTVTTFANETKNCTITAAVGTRPLSNFARGAGSSGALTITNYYQFSTFPSTLTNGPTIGTSYGYYDGGLTAGAVNWGIAINTQSYINANLSIGKNTTPAVPLDVVGAILNTTTIEAGTGFRCGGTAACADGVHTPVTSITTKGGIITAIS